jgi:hypothetical protein
MPRPSVIGRAPRSQPPRPQLAKSGTIPAPVGINTVDPAMAMSATDAFDLVNLVGGRLGPTSRLGFAEWCIGMGGNPVRSVLSFAGSVAAKDRLFACTSAAIFDVTTSSATPTSKHTFGTSNASTGTGIGTGYVTTAGHFYLYCDETNGYLLYTESTDAWTVVAAGAGAGQINGATPANFAFVTAWKNRVFFVEKATAKAWFLPVGQITGTVSVIDFGNKFQHGGTLVGLWSMTIDGGAGVDDYLVAVSSAGDVLVYQGSDPSTADAFSLTGSWYVGAMLPGRRVVTDYGGDVLVASQLGVVPLSRIRSGTIGPDTYATRKVQSLFNQYATDRRSLSGWALCLSPADNALLVNVPIVGGTFEQLAWSLATPGWSKFSGIPSLSFATWKGDLYFGTSDGRLCKATGGLDDVKLSGASTWREIEWSGLTSFQALGNTRWKQITEIRLRMLTQGAVPGYEVAARYDFDSSVFSVVPPDPLQTSVASWDVAKWDEVVWPGADTPCGSWRGASGMGVHAAIVFRGSSNARTTIMGFDVKWVEGGI